MRVAGDVDWSSIPWHRMTNAEVARQTKRSPTHVARVRTQEGFPATAPKARSTKVDSKDAARRARKAYRKLLDSQPTNLDPVIQIVEESTDSGLRFYILVDGRVFISEQDKPVMFRSLVATREVCEVLHNLAALGQKARVSLCLFKHIKGKLGDSRRHSKCSLVSWAPTSRDTSIERPCNVTRRRC